MKKYFICFADSRLHKTSARIINQANEIGLFDSVKALNESNLNSEFRSRFRDKLIIGSRGYGYWVWKPEIIYRQLLEMKAGDLLVYMDAGSHLNKEGRDRLLEYFEMAHSSASGVLAFDTSYPRESVTGIYTDKYIWDPHFHPNKKYIKGDALKYFGKLNDEEFLNDAIIEATHMIICKNDNSTALIKEWLHTAQQEFHLFDDSESQTPNSFGFIEHRHDQAIFSILGRKYGIQTLSNAETWYPSINNTKIPDWGVIKNFPFHGRRDKDFGNSNILMMKSIKSRVKNFLRVISRSLGLSVTKIYYYDQLKRDSRIVKSLSKSQLGQDKFVLEVLNYKKRGFFVEFGATNGVDLSNTYMLERHFDWTGILVEPARVWHDELKKSRRSRIVTDCVTERTGDYIEFIESENPELSSLKMYSSTDCHSVLRNNRVINYQVRTISLQDLLHKYDAPKIIDYLSIDTEGSEFTILNAFDFKKYEFKVITVEHNFTENRAKIYDLLTLNGYERVFENRSSFDDWYLRKK